jgi:uncharacterized protein DUF1648
MRLPLALFGLLAVAVAALIVLTTGRLPESVASHFGAGNLADAWMTRDFYLVWMLAFSVLLPVGIVAAIGGLPRAFPGITNLPNRDYWLAPERRADSLRFLAVSACWLGCLLTALAGAIHVLIIEANAVVPARLPGAMFFGLLAAFAAAFGAWLVAIFRRFRRPA